MFSFLALAAVVAQSSPGAELPPGWVAQDLRPGEYRRYKRTAQNGPDEELFGKMQICDCDPVNLVDELQTKLRALCATLAERQAANGNHPS